MDALPPGLHGAFVRADLVKLIGAPLVRSALAHRRLVPVTRTVLIDARRGTDFRTRAAAALLSAGADAALSSHTALALHGCAAADRAPIHLLVPYSCCIRPRDGVLFHRGRLDRTDVVQVEGLRSAAPDVALAEVLCRGSRRAGIACADQLLAAEDVDARAELRAWVRHRILARADPRGRQQALALLDLATGLPESPPESWTLLALVDGGFPPPVPQFAVVDIDGRVLYWLDLAWPELRIAVEYDGYAAHAGREALDAAREDDLRRRGWIVIRADAADMRNPQRLLAAVGAAFRLRGMAAA